MFTVELEGLDVLERVAAEIKASVPDIVQTAVRAGAQFARNEHTYKDHTVDGLTASIRGELDEADYSRGSAVGTLEASGAPDREPYARFVEEDTAAHDIEAKNGQMLRWEDASGVHFARKVRHPGTKSQPFMGPAYLKAERVIYREFDLVLARAAKVLEGT